MLNKIYHESCLKTINNLPDNYIDLVITSPPYWSLRDYDCKDSDNIGNEKNSFDYIDNIVNVYDPFMGFGTVGVVAKRNNRNFIGSEIVKEFVDLSNKRIKNG